MIFIWFPPVDGVKNAVYTLPRGEGGFEFAVSEFKDGRGMAAEPT
jgi:hypothetical protein